MTWTPAKAAQRSALVDRRLRGTITRIEAESLALLDAELAEAQREVMERMRACRLGADASNSTDEGPER